MSPDLTSKEAKLIMSPVDIQCTSSDLNPLTWRQYCTQPLAQIPTTLLLSLSPPSPDPCPGHPELLLISADLWFCILYFIPTEPPGTTFAYLYFITGPQISSEKKGRRNLENVTEQCWRVRAVLASRAWSWLWELLRAFWAGGWMLGCSIAGVHTLDARSILLSIWTANHASRCWQTSHGTDCWEPLLYTNLTD